MDYSNIQSDSQHWQHAFVVNAPSGNAVGTLDQITPQMMGKRIRMVCDGVLNAYEDNLLKIVGTRKKHLLVQPEGILAAGV